MSNLDAIRLAQPQPTGPDTTEAPYHEEWRDIKCAYCNGSGRDRWGLLSELSACSACGGRGRQRIRVPYRRCAHCNGTGVHPHLRVTCTTCSGLGSVHVKEPVISCPTCQGTGQDSHSEIDLACVACGGTGWVSVEQVAGKETHND